MKKLSILLFIALISFSCERVYIAATGENPTIKIVGNKARVNGVLGKRFYKKFSKFVEENPEVKTLILEDMPGSMNDEWNVKSCLLLHKKGLNTEVTSSSVIASGAVDLFISGNKRYISPGAQIGVHSWSEGSKEGSEYPKDAEEHKLFLDFFDEIGMDHAFYWYTLEAAPAADVHWMTEEEIEFYGLEKL